MTNAQSFNTHVQNGYFSTSGQIFNWKFEIFMARFLFDYEIWWQLRQDLCMIGAKNSFRDTKFPKFGARGWRYPFWSVPLKRYILGGFFRDARVWKKGRYKKSQSGYISPIWGWIAHLVKFNVTVALTLCLFSVCIWLQSCPTDSVC